MGVYLGIDTSNYTTSCALYNDANGSIRSCKKLLPVKEGERGIRQSDAVFHHTKQLPGLMEELLSVPAHLSGCSYSYAPREAEGSYMHPEPSSLLPPHTIPLGLPSALAFLFIFFY